MLRDHVPGYRPFDERFHYLFNSYYEGEGARLDRSRRGMISRPSLDDVRAYRTAIDERLERALPSLDDDALALIELGINHEQQHQELLLTDLLAAFAENPLEPAYGELPPPPASRPSRSPFMMVAKASLKSAQRLVLSRSTVSGPGTEYSSNRTSLPRGASPTANGGNSSLMPAIGTPTLWLSEGWDWVRRTGVKAPLYWRDNATEFTLAGRREIDWTAPVAHVSYYEADAFARWAGARLPTEAEWEDFAASADPNLGNQLDQAGPVLPRPGGGMFGDVWEWTRSAFTSYPGFAPAEGAVGEYNGKFMCGQFVLKGASCATPRGHSRASYRNFFPPDARWQFTGLRLARDA